MNVIKGLILSLLMTTALAGVDSNKIIYGEDHRQDLNGDVPAEWVEWSKATAAMVQSKDLVKVPGEDYYSFGDDKLSDNVCADERFADQPSLAFCSGFLVGKNLLLTAGHCITKETDCTEKYKWVFDYSVNETTGELNKIVDENIYSCKKIVSRELGTVDNILLRKGLKVSLKALTNKMASKKLDYALVELTRNAEGRTPLKFRKKARSGIFGLNRLREGDKLVMIGHPSGLPTKIADGAEVIAKTGGYFHANLDAFGGNSGSAVINEESGEVEGILVRGKRDYKYDSSAKCYRPNQISDNQTLAEESTFVTDVEGLANIDQ